MKQRAKEGASVLAALVLAALLGGCVTRPPGPSVMVLPARGADLGRFQLDDNDCRQYADGASQGGAEAAEGTAANHAAIGTVIGAAIGALLGAAGHDAAAGAAAGAGIGLVAGAAGGAGAQEDSARLRQQRYDNAYVQCMYARGHQVPVDASAAIQYNVGGPSRQVPAVPPPGTPAPLQPGLPPPGTPAPPGY